MRLSMLVSAAALVPIAVHAAPPATPAEIAKAFGAREDVQQISLSPGGTKVAIVSPDAGRGAMLRIAELGGGAVPRSILRSTGDPERLTDCRWITDMRLVCRAVLIMTEVLNGRDSKLGFTRMIAIDADGGNIKVLSARPNDRSLGVIQNGGEVIDWLAESQGGSVLMTRSFLPQATMDSNITRAEGLGVERVDTVSLQRRTVEPGRPTAADYITDGHGSVRLMGMQPKLSSGYDSSRILYSYRKLGSDTWQTLSTVSFPSGLIEGFYPVAVDSDLNVAYGYEVKDGHRALYKVSLDGSLKRDLVLARPDVDIATTVRVGRQNRVVGASFITDRRQTEFFDPDLKRLRASLEKVVAKGALVTFVDASADESKLLLYVGSDTDPGRYFLYDKKTRQLGEVLAVRSGLSQLPLGTMSAISYPAPDGTRIPGYLTVPAGSNGKNLPTIVMPHGGPGARDEWGFDWLAQFFAARGYAVLQPNFRGSTGYGTEWYRENGFKSWRTAIGDVNDAGRWLQAQGIAAPGKLAIVGWSYGGYAALQSAVLDPNLYKAIVAIAPVTDLEMMRDESRYFSNYAVIDGYIGHGPHISEGSPARNAAAIKAPVLMFHGDLDNNVGIEESRVMAQRLRAANKTVELVEYKKLDHQLDDSAVRAQMLEKADTFLRQSLKL